MAQRTCRERRLLVIVAALIVGAMGRELAAAAPAPFVDVDPALLGGTTLTIPDANFSVRPAGEGWIWKTRQEAASVSEEGPQRSFICILPGEVPLLIFVAAPPGVDHLSTRFMEGAKKGAMKVRSGTGERVTSFSYAATSDPIPGSYRLRMDIAGQAGAVRHCFGTVVWTGKVVTMESCAEAAEEPPALTALVRSFHTLVPPPAARSTVKDLSRPVAYVIWAVLAIGVVAAINRFSGRSFNVWRIGGYAVAALLVANIIVLACTEELQAMDPADQGDAVGHLMSSALPALLVAYVGGLVRKRNAARGAAAEPPPAAGSPPR